MYGSGGQALWWTGTANSELKSGEELHGTWYLESPSRGFKLIEQRGDGNLVLYNFANRALWASGTGGHPGAYAVLQAAGNLAVYSGTGQLLWSVGTAGESGSRLVLQSDGNLVLYSASGGVRWATGTS